MSKGQRTTPKQKAAQVYDEYWSAVSRGPVCKQDELPDMRPLLEKAIIAAVEEDRAGRVIDMLLFCPNCGLQHIDEAKPEVCETCGKSESECLCVWFTAWLNPPHKSHRCNGCNHVWRPADDPTNGVAAIQTKGERDGDPAPHTSAANAVALIGDLTKALEDLGNWLAYGLEKPDGAEPTPEDLQRCEEIAGKAGEVVAKGWQFLGLENSTTFPYEVANALAKEKGRRFPDTPETFAREIEALQRRANSAVRASKLNGSEFHPLNIIDLGLFGLLMQAKNAAELLPIPEKEGESDGNTETRA